MKKTKLFLIAGALASMQSIAEPVMDASGAYSSDVECADIKYERRKQFMPSGWYYKGENVRDAVLIEHAEEWNGEKLIIYGENGRPDRVMLGGIYASGMTDAVLDVDNEHIWPLYAAWLAGACHWPQALRVQFAHDKLLLFPVKKGINRGRGALLAFLPPDISNWPWFLEVLTAIYEKYPLEITSTQLKQFKFVQDKVKYIKNGIDVQEVQLWAQKVLECKLDAH